MSRFIFELVANAEQPPTLPFAVREEALQYFVEGLICDAKVYSNARDMLTDCFFFGEQE